jgi:hypothetical protein
MESKGFPFEIDCKFAILALHSVRAEVQTGIVLQDDIRVFDSFPFDLEDHWREWLGAIQFKRLRDCNLFLLRSSTEGWQQGQFQVAGDRISEQLQQDLGSMFAMLRMLVSIVYEDAFRLDGYVEKGKATCQRFATTEPFNITRGCLPWTINEGDLRKAAQLAKAYKRFQEETPVGQTRRLGRGCYSLKVGFERYYASDRLHAFVRALEALILPETGKTERQFVARCALFAGPKTVQAGIQEALREAYRMRCDIEHVHEWDRSLQAYSPTEREDVTFWRTRQMEVLASAAYTKILLDPKLAERFSEDSKLGAFWQGSEDEVRRAFGNICDISQLRFVQRYDDYGRAAPSE